MLPFSITYSKDKLTLHDSYCSGLSKIFPNSLISLLYCRKINKVSRKLVNFVRFSKVNRQIVSTWHHGRRKDFFQEETVDFSEGLQQWWNFILATRN